MYALIFMLNMERKSNIEEKNNYFLHSMDEKS